MSWYYVWTAYLVTMAAIGAEVLLLVRRRRALRRRPGGRAWEGDE
jgi:heme exporter protein CcmD